MKRIFTSLSALSLIIILMASIASFGQTKDSKITTQGAFPVINVEDHNFGAISVNSVSEPKVINIVNTGIDQLTITGFFGPTMKNFTTDLPTDMATNPINISKGGTYSFSISFSPDAVASFPDSIVFISDADRRLDPVCKLNGKGIQPALEATGDNWGRKRADLPKYTDKTIFHYVAPTGAIILTSTGTQVVTIDRLVVTEDINGDAFEVLDYGKYVPLKSVLKKYAMQIQPGANFKIPVFFHPTKEGVHKLVIEYRSDASPCTSTLEGIGIFPKLSTSDYDFGTSVIGAVSSKRTIRFTNENWGEYSDDVMIDNLVVNPAGAINVTLGATPKGTEGFEYGKAGILLNGKEPIILPLSLTPGEYIEFPAEFYAVKSGAHSASITTISDAETEVTSHWTGNKTGSSIKDGKTIFGSVSIVSEPVFDILAIKFETEEARELAINLIDISGKIIANFGKFSAASGLNYFNMDVCGISAGKYFLIVSSADRNMTKTVVIGR